ncbi:MAG: tRNA (adenosine(37)-N6)-dimethylallyltransferase MiaA [Cyanobacteria bacterium P01_A01_bin.123]
MYQCLIVIGGATATGKSGLAVAIADKFNGVILSADSRQVYREFDIGTAKPTLAQRQAVSHYLIDICNPTETLTLATYQRQAQTLIQRFHSERCSLPFLVGGTGLYINAVVKGLKIPPVSPQPQLRSQLQALGQSHCHALLQQVDPDAAVKIHPHDSVRTLRALEVFYVSGQTISSQQGENPPTYPILYLALDCSPESLQTRIQQRTQVMVDQGFLSEVESLCQRYGFDLPLLKTLGYAEMLQYLQDKISRAEAIALTVKHTRQFAKRQRTWFRNTLGVEWFDADAPDLMPQVAQRIEDFLSCQG